MHYCNDLLIKMTPFYGPRYSNSYFIKRSNDLFFRLKPRVFAVSYAADWRTTKWIWRQHVAVNYSYLPVAGQSIAGPFNARRMLSHDTILGLFCHTFGSNNCVSIAIKSAKVEELDWKHCYYSSNVYGRRLLQQIKRQDDSNKNNNNINLNNNK